MGRGDGWWRRGDGDGDGCWGGGGRDGVWWWGGVCPGEGGGHDEDGGDEESCGDGEQPGVAALAGFSPGCGAEQVGVVVVVHRVALARVVAALRVRRASLVQVMVASAAMWRSAGMLCTVHPASTRAVLKDFFMAWLGRSMGAWVPTQRTRFLRPVWPR